MLKKIFVQLIFLVSFQFTQAQSKKPSHFYKIDASIGVYDSSYLLIIADGETLYKDSLQNGGFHISGYVDKVKEAYFILKTKKAILTKPFYLEPGTIRIQDHSRKGDKWQVYNFSFSGTPNNDLAFNFVNLLDSLFGLKSPASGGDFKANYQEKRAYVQKYILTHKNSILTLRLFRSYFLYENISEEDKLSLFNSIDKSVRSTFGGKELGNKVNALVSTSLGKKAPYFQLPDTLNRGISLNQFRGSYVLLDFWASWCIPCREENPAIRKVYDEFKDSGLLIISVSLDTDREKWLRAIKEDQMDWIHVSDLKGWENAVAKQYYIESIPANFLLDPNGVIIAKNLRGDELGMKLSICFNK